MRGRRYLKMFGHFIDRSMANRNKIIARISFGAFVLLFLAYSMPQLAYGHDDATRVETLPRAENFNGFLNWAEPILKKHGLWVGKLKVYLSDFANLKSSEREMLRD